MKKTILAIAIPALFASAANAAVIYDKDGTTFDVYGRVQANYFGESGDDSAELKGSSRLGWKGKVALNNTWSALARTEWQVAAEDSGYKTSDIDPRHIYVGFDGSQYGQFLFGQTDTA
ncbi:MAG: porin, partial [Aeromonas sp.]